MCRTNQVGFKHRFKNCLSSHIFEFIHIRQSINNMYTPCHIRIFNSIIRMCALSVSTACGCILIRTFYHFSRKVLFQRLACIRNIGGEPQRQQMKIVAEAHPKVAISELSQHQSSKYGLDRSNRLTNITVQSSFHLELLNKGNNTHPLAHIHSETICDYSFMCIMLENEPPPFLHRQQHARTYIALHSLTHSLAQCLYQSANSAF